MQSVCHRPDRDTDDGATEDGSQQAEDEREQAAQAADDAPIPAYLARHALAQQSPKLGVVGFDMRLQIAHAPLKVAQARFHRFAGNVARQIALGCHQFAELVDFATEASVRRASACVA